MPSTIRRHIAAANAPNRWPSVDGDRTAETPGMGFNRQKWQMLIVIQSWSFGRRRRAGNSASASRLMASSREGESKDHDEDDFPCSTLLCDEQST